MILAATMGLTTGCTDEGANVKKGEKIVFAEFDSSSESATDKEKWVTQETVSIVEGTEGTPAVTEWEYSFIPFVTEWSRILRERSRRCMSSVIPMLNLQAFTDVLPNR